MLDGLFDLLILLGLGIGVAFIGLIGFDRVHRAQMKQLDEESKESP